MDINVIQLVKSMQEYSYIPVFVLMVVDGPIVTAVAAFAVSLGYFDAIIIFILSILGNTLPDMFFFFLGKYCRGATVLKIIAKAGLNEQVVKKIEEGFRAHAVKTITITKLTPFIPIPAIILTGFAQVPSVTFLKTIFVFNFICTIAFMGIGYNCGILLDRFSAYFKIQQFSVLALLLFGCVIYLLDRKLRTRLLKIFRENNHEYSNYL